MTTSNRAAQRLRVVRGAGCRPTLAADVVSARDELTVADELGLALREHRRALGASQRAYAAQRGWSKTHQHRLEKSPGELKLTDVVEALAPTGFVLALVRQDADDLDAGGVDVTRVDPASWPPAELVARDAAGRRFPARQVARRTGILEPAWWWRAHSTEALAEGPLWTATASWTPTPSPRRDGPPTDPRPSPTPPGSVTVMTEQPAAPAQERAGITSASRATLTPKLVVRDADAALAFYRAVFGASLVERHAFRGKVVFALLELFDRRISLKDEDEHDPAPTTTGRPGVLFEITTADPDDVAASVVAAGGEVVFAVADQPYGARGGRVRDPFGHEWLVQTPVTLSPEETEAALEAAAPEQR